MYCTRQCNLYYKLIKLRTKTGKRLKVSEDVSFIEICDMDGRLGALVHIFPSGEIKVCTPGDDSFDRYARFFGSNLTDYAEKIDDEMRRVEQHDNLK